MHQSMLRVFVLCSLIYCYVCIHVAFTLKGWKAVPLDNEKAVTSMVIAAEHLGLQLKQAVTAFQWSESVADWDLYRVSFLSVFQYKTIYECHADAVWIYNFDNVTVFNTGCVPVSNTNNLDYEAKLF